MWIQGAPSLIQRVAAATGSPKECESSASTVLEDLDLTVGDLDTNNDGELVVGHVEQRCSSADD